MPDGFTSSLSTCTGCANRPRRVAGDLINRPQREECVKSKSAYRPTVWVLVAPVGWKRVRVWVGGRGGAFLPIVLRSVQIFGHGSSRERERFGLSEVNLMVSCVEGRGSGSSRLISSIAWEGYLF